MVVLQPRRLKGVNFRGTVLALERSVGPERTRQVLEKITGPAGSALRSNEIISGGWYPADWYDSLLRAMEESFPDDPDVCRRISREAVKNDLSTIFKVLSFVVSSRYAIQGATKMISRYVDGGRVAVLRSVDGEIHFRFDDFHGYTKRMWEDFLGGMEALIEMLGLTRLPPRIIHMGDGPSFEVVLCYEQPSDFVATSPR